MIATGENIDPADFIATSAGAGDSGKVAKLNATGKFDESFLAVFSRSLVGVVIDRFEALSSYVQHTNAAGAIANQTLDSSYAKCAEITLNEDIDLLRVRWKVERITISGGSSTYRDSAVFVNGVQVSSDIAWVSDATIHTYDIGAGLTSGDLLQIYARKNSTTEQHLRISNVDICYDSKMTSIAGAVLVTAILCVDPDGPDVTDSL